MESQNRPKLDYLQKKQIYGIVMDFSVESLMSCYAGSRKSKTMLLEWSVAPKSMITLHQF